MEQTNNEMKAQTLEELINLPDSVLAMKNKLEYSHGCKRWFSEFRAHLLKINIYLSRFFHHESFLEIAPDLSPKTIAYTKRSLDKVVGRIIELSVSKHFFDEFFVSCNFDDQYVWYLSEFFYFEGMVTKYTLHEIYLDFKEYTDGTYKKSESLNLWKEIRKLTEDYGEIIEIAASMVFQLSEEETKNILDKFGHYRELTFAEVLPLLEP